MYRLVLYLLLILVGYGSVLGFAKVLPFNGLAVLGSATLLCAICWGINYIFGKVFDVPTNLESSLITALILALIITPVGIRGSWAFLIWAAVLSMASKYILAIKHKHIFNPVAIGLVLATFAINSSTASWWVGIVPMAPVAIIAMLLIARKIRRFDLVFSFLVVAIIATILSAQLNHNLTPGIVKISLFASPLFFFAAFMLTEPTTTPPRRNLRIAYGSVLGLLYMPALHIGSVYSTPELALVLGNIFSYSLSPKEKLVLTFKHVQKIASNTYDFVFATSHKPKFRAGQFMEWTLGHVPLDSRGNRRYFTIASSPTEPDFRIGVRFNPKASAFKHELAALKPGDKIYAGQLAGDFTLAKSASKKLVFIAGGIGVTPYRSIIQYLLDSHQSRDIVMFYANKTAPEIAYANFFSSATKRMPLKMIYILDDKTKTPQNWRGKIGFIDAAMVNAEVPDWRERTFYISGPNAMVENYKKLLTRMGVSKRRIVTDYFPGF